MSYIDEFNRTVQEDVRDGLVVVNEAITRYQSPLLGGLVVFLLVFPLVASTYYQHLIILVFLFGILTSSWNIISGFAGYISFGHIFFFGVGAYFSGYLVVTFGLSPFLTAPLAGLLAMLLAVPIGLATLRLRGPYFAIATLAVAVIGQLTISNIGELGAGEGLVLPANPWPVEVMRLPFYYGLFAVLVATVAMAWYVSRSNFGLWLRAIREDEAKAEAIGINTSVLKSSAFILSAFFPGVAGAVYGYYLGYLAPADIFSILYAVNILVMTIFGGIGTIAGPLFGSGVLTLISENLTYTPLGQYKQFFFGLLLAVVTLKLPDGVLPMAREYLQTDDDYQEDADE